MADWTLFTWLQFAFCGLLNMAGGVAMVYHFILPKIVDAMKDVE